MKYSNKELFLNVILNKNISRVCYNESQNIFQKIFREKFYFFQADKYNYLTKNKKDTRELLQLLKKNNIKIMKGK